jgi:hypothetical protein
MRRAFDLTADEIGSREWHSACVRFSNLDYRKVIDWLAEHEGGYYACRIEAIWAESMSVKIWLEREYDLICAKMFIAGEWQMIEVTQGLV